MACSQLIFFVNGKKIILNNPDPETTLLKYLRRDLFLTGTKLGCGEGGCGACTVMISSLQPGSDTIKHFSANACIYPLCLLHGMAVTTVEGIGSLRTGLHPVQKILADAHGIQCGFCSPGFVMSMYALLRNNPTPSLLELSSNFDGNLCRCTGYRSIMQGFKNFTKEFCDQGGNCCRNQTSVEYLSCIRSSSIPNGLTQNLLTDAKDEDVYHMIEDDPNADKCATYNPDQDPIFPPYLKLEGKQLHNESLHFVGERVAWYRPTSLQELLRIKKDHPDCKLVIGNTEIGIESKFKNKVYPVLAAVNHVMELQMVEQVDCGIKIGASVTLAELNTILQDAIRDLPESKTRVFLAFVEMLRWFAGQQIRNVAGLAGNIMTASPVSDLNPLLLASGAVLQLMDTDKSVRQVKMDENFFKGYRQTSVLPSEILISVLIPFTQENEYFYGFKQAQRKEDDIAIVNAAMRVILNDQSVITDLSLAFGGMAPTTIMALQTMKQLIGHSWNEELMSRARDLLTCDLPLEPGATGGDIAFRRTLTVSFFFKFYLMVLERLQRQEKSMNVKLKSSDVSAIYPLEHQICNSLQCFEKVPSSQSPFDALRRPIVHESAYKQATGEAVYVDDITPRKDELYLAFVLSTKAHAKILQVDPTLALGMPGVVDYVSHKDIPGRKTWGEMQEEEVFATEKVVHQGQIIGAILADTQENAQRAVHFVTVLYEELEPIITITVSKLASRSQNKIIT